MALVLEEFPPGAPILMEESDHVGALQEAGIPLRQTVNESDYDSWKAALEDPAAHAAYVIAIEGDPVAKAVAAHPEGLKELSVLCRTGQPLRAGVSSRISYSCRRCRCRSRVRVLPSQRRHDACYRVRFTSADRTDGAVAGHDDATADGVRDGRRGGMEREWRHKASGLRTNMLICMGCALFTMLSAVLAGEANPEQRAGGFEHCAGDWVSGRGADPAYAQPGAGADERGDGVGGGVRLGWPAARGCIWRRRWLR